MEKEESLFNVVSCGELFIVKDTPCKWWISCNICKNKFENLENFLNHIINSHLNKEFDDTLQARTEHCSIENTNTIGIKDKVIAVALSTRSNCNGKNNQNVERNNESNSENELDNKTIRAIENNKSDIENEFDNNNAETSESIESDIENELGNKNIGAIENKSDIGNELGNKNAETIENNESDIENEVDNKNTRIIENNESEYNIVAKSLTDLDPKFENSNQKLEASIDKKGERHQCPHCERNYASRKSLLKHIKTHFQLKQLFKCEECGATLTSKRSLKLHMRLHTGERPEKCNICSKTFRLPSTLVAHLLTHTATGERHQCPHCERNYASRKSLLKHIKTHFGLKQLHKCEECGATLGSKRSLKFHMRLHTGERPEKCNICSKTFRTPSHLRLHLMIHKGIKKFSCSFCEKKFRIKSQMEIHERVHKGEKPAVCDICGGRFRCNAALKTHSKKHAKIDSGQTISSKGFNKKFRQSNSKVNSSKEKKFQCEICLVYLSSVSGLRTHKQTHTASKKYLCRYCDNGFRTYSGLIYHMVKEHECKPIPQKNYTIQQHNDRTFDIVLPVKSEKEKPFVCKTCGTKYANQKCLKMHERFHAETKDYKCNMCDECFRTYANLNYHMRKEHDCLAKENSNYILIGGKRRK